MTCSPPPPTLYTVVSAESFGEEEEEEEEESDLEGTAPTPKRRKLAREKTLTHSRIWALPSVYGILGSVEQSSCCR